MTRGGTGLGMKDKVAYQSPPPPLLLEPLLLAPLVDPPAPEVVVAVPTCLPLMLQKLVNQPRTEVMSAGVAVQALGHTPSTAVFHTWSGAYWQKQSRFTCGWMGGTHAPLAS